MNENIKDKKLTIDGVDYFMDDLSDVAKSQIANIQFSDQQILQRQNELAISNTARVGYLKELKVELEQVGKVGS